MTPKKIKDHSSSPPDQDQRDLILEALDRNMLVEAAAGTGKTTCMVRRMVALIESGRCKQIRSMAAVTFTRKAAAELRSRFQVEMERAVRDAGEGKKQRLLTALSNIEQCFVGTIHAFCGRLLRERPVEANVDPAFEEIDEEEDRRLRREAWGEYTARLLVSDRDGNLEELDRLGLRLEELEDTFLRFSDFPDVECWPVPAKENALPDMDERLKKFRGYIAYMRKIAGDLPDDYGNDTLIPEYKRLPRRVSHIDLEDSVELMKLLKVFSTKRKAVQYVWADNSPFSKEDAKKEEERWNEFKEQVAEPLFRAWYEQRYGPILRLMFRAGALYDQLRHARGQLNFQDLLIRAASLLRNHPHVRQYFQNRFSHLLVDEFQDTDPVQAEVMLLLTATDLEEKDWRRCRPRPGSLFVVGDPKQSIYRFRRADIVTYNEVKDIICQKEQSETAGLLVRLSANFRATGDMIDWVNTVFEPEATAEETVEDAMVRFPSTETGESPAYVELLKGRKGGHDGTLSGVFSLCIPAEYSNIDQAVIYEADRIARIIRHALDGGMTIPRTQDQIQAGETEKARPSDFMIITRFKKRMEIFARCLQEYGIPHQVTGGSALNRVGELKLLYVCLLAVISPDDPVALVGALRSELFGISDDRLYRFKKAGGLFSYHGAVPDSLSEADGEAFHDAFSRLEKYYGWLSERPPVTAIECIEGDLGLMVLAGARPGGDIDAGSLGKAIEILRNRQNETWTTLQIVEHLGRLVEKETAYDGMTARSEAPSGVRVMNLHKVKGLEAPVVFLANPSPERDRDISIFIDRSGDQVAGYMAVDGKARRYHRPRIARPAEWEDLGEREKKFGRAEALRLRYVAATRAASAMVITRRGKKNGQNPWRYFMKYIPADREISDPEPKTITGRKKDRVSLRMVEQAGQEVKARMDEVRKPTYRVAGAKAYALAKQPEQEPGRRRLSARDDPETPESESGEFGVEWGTVIHRMLELSMNHPEKDLLHFARESLIENSLDAGLAAKAHELVKAVMKSKIWQQARESISCFTEIPFQVLEEKAETPILLRGVIDLVFKESGGWILVDYKTDNPRDGNMEDLLKKYAPQMRLYKQAWERCTGEAVKEAGLYFVSRDSYQPIE